MRALTAIAIEYEILGFIDSNVSEKNKEFLGKPLIGPAMLKDLKFDEVIVASSFIDEIVSTLSKENVTNVKILDELHSTLALSEKIHEHFGDTQETVLGETKQLGPFHLEDTQLLTDRVELLKRLPKYTKCVELGVANGDFSRQILEYLKPEELNLVDLWGSERYNTEMYQSVRKYFANHASTNTNIYRQSSIDACSLFADESLDFVYIDTTHGYKTTKAELEMYSKKLKPNGILAGHDFSQGNWRRRSRYGVIEAVYDFCVQSNWKLKYLTMDITEKQSFALSRN